MEIFILLLPMIIVLIMGLIILVYFAVRYKKSIAKQNAAKMENQIVCDEEYRYKSFGTNLPYEGLDKTIGSVFWSDLSRIEDMDGYEEIRKKLLEEDLPNDEAD